MVGCHNQQKRSMVFVQDLQYIPQILQVFPRKPWSYQKEVLQNGRPSR